MRVLLCGKKGEWKIRKDKEVERTAHQYTSTLLHHIRSRTLNTHCVCRYSPNLILCRCASSLLYYTRESSHVQSWLRARLPLTQKAWRRWSGPRRQLRWWRRPQRPSMLPRAPNWKNLGKPRAQWSPTCSGSGYTDILRREGNWIKWEKIAWFDLMTHGAVGRAGRRGKTYFENFSRVSLAQRWHPPSPPRQRGSHICPGRLLGSAYSRSVCRGRVALESKESCSTSESRPKRVQ